MGVLDHNQADVVNIVGIGLQSRRDPLPADSSPRGAGIRQRAIPDSAAADAASVPPTWAVASPATNPPDRT